MIKLLIMITPCLMYTLPAEVLTLSGVVSLTIVATSLATWTKLGWLSITLKEYQSNHYIWARGYKTFCMLNSAEQEI